jgi:glycerol-3-phosphate acyltransferase PlsY
LINLLWLAAAGYGLGSLPFGVWVSRLVAGRDIRSGGSGHSGATNTLRQLGLGPAVLVVVLDLAKGYVAGWLAVRYGEWVGAPAMATAALVAGHCWPFLAGFRGGMGLAALGGAMLAIAPLGFVVGLALALAGLLVLRHGARGTFVAGLLYGPVMGLLTREAGPALAAGAGGIVVAARALSNWRRVYRSLWLDRARGEGQPATAAGSKRAVETEENV